MLVGEWIKLHPRTLVTVHVTDELPAVISAMLSASGLRDVYVVDVHNTKPIGRITHKKLAEFVLMKHRPIHTTRQLLERVTAQTAADLMLAHIDSAKPDEQLDDVVFRQLEQEIEDMPVLDTQGSVVGVLNLTDLIRYFAEDTKGVE